MSNRRRYDAARRRQREAQLLATGTPVPSRIDAALDLRGLYGPEVDRACGVEEPTADLWEAGEVVPTGEQVQALGRLTRFPVAFFHQPHVPVGPVWVCRRGHGGSCELGDRDPPPAPARGHSEAKTIPLPGAQPTLF